MSDFFTTAEGNMKKGLAGKSSPQIGLRIPPEMKEQIKAAAKANRRSVNSEIIVAIEHHLEMAGIISHLEEEK